MKRLWILPLLVVTSLIACKKKDVTPDIVSQYENYTFQNKTGKPIIIRLTDTVGHKVSLINLQPGQLYYFPYHQMKDGEQAAGFTYYWASTDFTMSNWYIPGYFNVRPSFGYLQNRISYNIPIEPVPTSDRMRYFLFGIDGSTQWEAIDAYDSTGKSVWDTLNNSKKNHVVIINYDKTGTHRRSNYIGANITDHFYYDFTDDIVFKSITAFSTYYNSADTSIHDNYRLVLTNDLIRISPSWPKLSTKSTDTLFLVAPGNPSFYKMIKHPLGLD